MGLVNGEANIKLAEVRDDGGYTFPFLFVYLCKKKKILIYKTVELEYNYLLMRKYSFFI